MRLNKLLVPLAFSMLFSSGVSAASDNTASSCYGVVTSITDLAVTKRMGLKLCSGTPNARLTILCFLNAVGRDKNGLGLDIGSAVNLCKNNSEPF